MMESEQKQFVRLVEVIDRLIGPGGCPWDQEQTLMTLRKDVLGETYELIEAIEDQDFAYLKEELGDHFFVALFLCRIALRDHRISTEEVLAHVEEKMVRRHPHVFEEKKLDTADQVVHQWEEIKKQEKRHRKSGVDGIPKTLPALARAQKVRKAFHKAGFSPALPAMSEEEQLCADLLQTIQRAVEKKIDLESSLLRRVRKEEEEFRSWEESANHSPK